MILMLEHVKKKSHYLRGLDGRGQFLTLSISLNRRALYNGIEKHSNFKFSNLWIYSLLNNSLL